MTPQSFLIKSFLKMSASQTIALAREVKFRLTDHKVITEPFPSYVPSLQKLGEGADGLETACYAARNRGLEQIAQKNQCCTALQADLGTVAHHAEMVAQGDTAVLLTCGFPFKKTRGKVTARKVPDAPELHVTRGDKIGSLMCTVIKGCKGGSTEVQITDGDPTVEANWRKAGDGIFVLAKFELTGNQPETRYVLRARCVTSGGTGPWSAYVTIVCL